MSIYLAAWALNEFEMKWDDVVINHEENLNHIKEGIYFAAQAWQSLKTKRNDLVIYLVED